MDKRTRGFMEKELDEAMKINLTDTIRWIFDVLPISSPEEFVLGYYLGYLTRWAYDAIRIRKINMRRKVTDVTVKDAIEIRDMLRRRLQDIMEKINRELGR